jgi:hypothetical protein
MKKRSEYYNDFMNEYNHLQGNEVILKEEVEVLLAKYSVVDFGMALEALNEGKKIKVPEWKGYWFKESGMVMVMTAEEKILETPHFQQYIFRTDWQIFD